MSKYKQVKINLTEEQHQALSLVAQRQNITLAELFRQSVNVDFEDKRVTTDKRETMKADPKLLYHLAKIGNNINQIAKYVNESKSFDRLAFTKLVEIKEQLDDYKN